MPLTDPTPDAILAFLRQACPNVLDMSGNPVKDWASPGQRNDYTNEEMAAFIMRASSILGRYVYSKYRIPFPKHAP